MPDYIISKSLAADIEYIRRRADSMKKSAFEIAWKLHAIVDTPDFADSGYPSIVEFAAENFGFARSTTLNYIAIANKYLTTEHTPAGHKDKLLTTTCAKMDGGKVTSDYGIGQLNALGKTTADDFITMDSEGVISPDMSAKSIKDAVKNWYADPASEPAPDPEPDADPEEQEEQEEQDAPKYTFTLPEIVRALYMDIIGDDYDFDMDCALDSALQHLTGGKVHATMNCSIEDGDKIIDTVDVLGRDTDDIILTYPPTT